MREVVGGEPLGDGGEGDAAGFGFGVGVDAGGDAGEGDGVEVGVCGEAEGFFVAGGEEVGFTIAAAVVDGADGVDDVA